MKKLFLLSILLNRKEWDNRIEWDKGVKLFCPILYTPQCILVRKECRKMSMS